MAGDPYRYFRLEAAELVEHMTRDLLELARSGEAKTVASVLRHAHTLKGAARVVRLGPIADRAHALEDALALHREGTTAPIDVAPLLAVLDEIRDAVAALSGEGPASAPAAVEAVPREVRAEVGELDSLLEGLTEAGSSVRAIRRTSDTVAELLRAADELVRRMAANNTAYEVLAAAEDIHAGLSACQRELDGTLEHALRELGHVRGAAEQLRLVSATTLLATLERTVHDVARSQGKRVTFESRGHDIRLDAHVLATVQRAFVQLVRNAVAHGVEAEDERRRAGKPAVGVVRVEVSRRGRLVAFTCKDDGRGLDVEAVRRAAARAIPASAQMTPRELVNVLLRGGITTSTRVTEVSGRGVGLDVVRDAAERLGGEIHVETEPGRGTAFEMVVPPSLTAIDALQFDVAGTAAAVPLTAVRKTFRIPETQISHDGEGERVVYEERFIPLLRLAHLFDPDRAAPAAVHPAMIVASGGRVAAVCVGRLRGASTIVVRPIPEIAAADPVVAGASLDEDGNPCIVLDPEAVIEAAMTRRTPQPAVERARTCVLVIDDSLTTRMLEQSILESAGYEVDTATSAEDGFVAVKRKRYALILVDVEMPGADGFTFIEQLRADPALRDIPAILVSSRAAAEDFRRGEAVGAQGYIVKSEFDQVELLARMERLIGSRR